MTDEFRAGMPDAATVRDWANGWRWTRPNRFSLQRQPIGINPVFGRLGNVVRSEIVDHEHNLRSVYFYYQGSKRPAKIWVTFRGTDIAGFHYNVWKEGYAERKSASLEQAKPSKWQWFGLGIVVVGCVLFCWFSMHYGQNWMNS
jgi:hypothetical protein